MLLKSDRTIDREDVKMWAVPAVYLAGRWFFVEARLWQLRSVMTLTSPEIITVPLSDWEMDMLLRGIKSLTTKGTPFDHYMDRFAWVEEKLQRESRLKFLMDEVM